MSPTKFDQLPRELRDMIWQEAAAVQYQHIADGFPEPCTDPGAERLRQAFVGYDDLPHGTEKQPLKLHVHDFENKLYLGVHEFQILLNCLPMATVCSEARSHAAKFCRDQVKIVDLIYTKEPNDVGNEILEHRFLQPATVMVTIPYQPENDFAGFSSANRFVDIHDRFFGDCIERLTLNFWFDAHNNMEQIYWPHVGKTRILQRPKPIFIDDSSHEKFIVFVTPERTMHVKEELYAGNEPELQILSDHLLKFHELLDICKKKQKLPRLLWIELKLHTYSWGEELLTCIKAVIKDGSLWVNFNEAQIGFEHTFSEWP